MSSDVKAILKCSPHVPIFLYPASLDVAIFPNPASSDSLKPDTADPVISASAGQVLVLSQCNDFSWDELASLAQVLIDHVDWQVSWRRSGAGLSTEQEALSLELHVTTLCFTCRDKPPEPYIELHSSLKASSHITWQLWCAYESYSKTLALNTPHTVPQWSRNRGG